VKLSSRGDYAVRALLEIALAPPDQPTSLATVASRTGIPFKYLEQIFKLLRAAQVVRARRGKFGGYTLARPADQVTVGEVIRVLEGPLAPTLCASRTQHAPCPAYLCPSESDCVLRGMWVDVRDAISSVVDHTTFADLAQRQRDRQPTARYQI
jgi:Rrf2 family cysteine metabolism transcriptional repressor